jgi:hypothetical protein
MASKQSDDEKKLLFDMQMCCLDDSLRALQSGAEKRKAIAELMLSVVKQNIGSVARVCPECGGNSGLGDSCSRCKDVGVVSK